MSATTTSARRTRSAGRRERRSLREEAIVAATREVFERRGARDARVDEIARAAGLNKALIYRVFLSKDEIFVHAATSYLDELRESTNDLELDADVAVALRQLLGVFADFCTAYPAFLDCGLSLLHHPAAELRETLSDASWFRLSRAVARCVGPVQRLLQAGIDDGSLVLDDAGFAAGRLLTGMMGTLHLARIGVSIQEPAPGSIAAFPVTAGQVVDAAISDAMAIIGLREQRRG